MDVRFGTGSFTYDGPPVGLRASRKIAPATDAFILGSGWTKIYHLKGTLAAGAGTFTFTGINTTLTVTRKISAVSAEFLFLGNYVGIYKTNEVSYLLDDLAADAPAAQDYFVPIMGWSQPIVVLSLDAVFGPDSRHVYSSTFIDYYNQDTNTWNDAAYTEQNPGETIPVSLKAQVSDQLYLYNNYLVANTRWLAEYNMEFNLQWPYWWAREVLARR